jgi:hypothetical protein
MKPFGFCYLAILVFAYAPSRSLAGDNAFNPTHDKPASFLSKTNLMIFGFSYHTDREGVKKGRSDNEVNAGLGLDYEFHEDARGIATLQAGVFKDSGSNWAKFGGVGYGFKLSKHWRLGADLLVFESATYNKGSIFVAPIPRIGYRWGNVQLNAVYIPRLMPYVEFEALAFYLTVPLSKR